MGDMAKNLIVMGFMLILIGAALGLVNKWPWAGKLPGDILIKKENFTFYFPLGTSLVLSLLLSLILMFLGRR